jgi:hypothetical protein
MYRMRLGTTAMDSESIVSDTSSVVNTFACPVIANAMDVFNHRTYFKATIINCMAESEESSF